MYQKSRLRNRRNQEGPRNVRKYRKSNKNFSCYGKRLSNKYGKNSKNNKFNDILQLEREKVKKGFEMSANFAKVTRICYYVKRLSNKYGKNSKNNKFHKILHLERGKVKKGFDMSAIFVTLLSSNFVMLSIFAKMKSSVTNVTLFIITNINLCMLRSSINIQLQCIERSVAHRRGQIFNNKTRWLTIVPKYQEK